LYPIGYAHEKLESLNRDAGSPVRIRTPLPHKDMPGLFKRHEWLVYTADWDIGTVGWPVSVAEAQAAGVGIVMPDLRPDIRDYVGPAGFVYRSLDEVREILSAPYPESMRRAGFDHARRSDVHAQIATLTDLFAQVADPT
jgi:glycosyltransferase involved in cell wall biosynthesis